MATDAVAVLRPPRLSVAMVAAAAIAWEVLLTRMFSIGLWHHFAYMIISGALLGYGASGAFLALVSRALLDRFTVVFPAVAAAAGFALPLSAAIAQQIPFNPLELPWDPAQALKLLALYLTLMLPFFLAGLALGLAIARFPSAASRVYAFDIVGASVGSALVVVALHVWFPAAALLLTAVLGAAAGAVAWLECGGAPRWPALALLLAAGLLALVPPAWVAPRLSEYKDLAGALRIPGARVVAQRSSPLGLVTVIENLEVPLRHAPGLGLMAEAEPPPQLAVFVDGDGPSPITRFDGRAEPLLYLDHLTSALPYRVLRQPRVLVLGAGTGTDVLQALVLGASSVDAVEMNPDVVALVGETFATFAGRLYQDPRVRVHIAEARAYASGSRERWDLVQISLLDPFGAATAGLQALAENYTYTEEALRAYLDRLAPGGLLAVTRWAGTPPRDGLKLFATAVRVLAADGSRDPGRRLALVSGWRTTTLLVKNGDFTPAELDAIRTFCRTRGFDIAWLSGMAPEEAGRFMQQDRPQLHEGAVALLGPDRNRFVADYKFHIEPASDDRPHFFRFFRWSAAGELLALREQGGLPLLDWGYPLLVVALLQGVLAGVALILLPVARLARAVPGAPRLRTAVYFGALGLGFMLLEIAFIQKFTLLLGNPVYAVALVLTVFLAGAGAGSALASERLPVRAAAAGIAAWAVLLLAALAVAGDSLVALPGLARATLAVLAVLPLAFLMGVPFPAGVAWLGRASPALVPWAWAVNGCASVVGAVVAALLAVHLGFSAVVAWALACYAVAAFALPRVPAAPAS